jgi:hypothetical protein
MDAASRRRFLMCTAYAPVHNLIAVPSEENTLVAQMKHLLTADHTPIFYLIDKKKNGLAKMFPDATADIILICLEVAKFLYPDENVANVWRDLRSSVIKREKLHKIREAMVRLGHDPGEA